MNNRSLLIGMTLSATLTIVGTKALALPMTFFGSQGSLAASATFDVSSSDLLVTLTNTSAADVLVPTDVLTAVFFDISGNPSLTRFSAIVASGSSVFFGGTDPGDVVGGEWSYLAGISGTPGNATQGISSVGFGIFGPGNLFPGTNLQGPTSPDGLQYGITSAGDNTATGNTPVTGANALIQNSVLFTLSGLPGGFSLSQISNVQFQYGTNLSDTSFPGTVPGGGTLPVPSSLLTMVLGLGCVALVRRRRS